MALSPGAGLLHRSYMAHSDPIPRIPVSARPLSDPTLSDEEIVERVRVGDVAFFEVLMRRHNARLYRAVRSILRDEDEAEDAMQQAYIHAYGALGEFQGHSSFSSWLIRIGLNEALMLLRKRRRLIAVDEITKRMESRMPTVPTPEERVTSRQAIQLLEKAIDRLPAIYRTAIMLREVEGLSTEETARALGVSEQAIKTRLHRARVLLHDALAEELGRELRDAFPFPAFRCDRVVNAVMARLSNGVA